MGVEAELNKNQNIKFKQENYYIIITESKKFPEYQ